MKPLTKQHISSIYKPRIAASHKGTYGHALLIAGNVGSMGAAVIATKACLRSGVGLVTTNAPNSERAILQTSIPEAMVIDREERIETLNNYTAIGIGPAIGTDKYSIKLLSYILQNFNHTMVLDADALNCMALNNKKLLTLPKECILTPHPKEFDRLFGIQKNTKERMRCAIEKAKELDVIIVLKGHETIITNNGNSFINTNGNAGLAKGGSGDALTGIITAFLAQGYKPFDAAKLGVYIHGLAADITLNEQSMESMLITDVIGNLGNAFKTLIK